MTEKYTGPQAPPKDITKTLTAEPVVEKVNVGVAPLDGVTNVPDNSVNPYSMDEFPVS